MYRNNKLTVRGILTCYNFGKRKVVTHWKSVEKPFNRPIVKYRDKYIINLKLSPTLVPCYNFSKCRFSSGPDYKSNSKADSNSDKSTEARNTDQKESINNNEKTENIFTIPNIITTCRIVATPYLGYLVLHEQFSWAVGLFVIAGISDVVDGYIARNFKNQMSVLGSALDPLADKVLISVLTVTLTMANLLPVPLTLTIIGRDVFLIVASCIYRYKSIQPPVTVSKYFNAKNASVKFYPSNLSKFNTAIQISLVTLTLAAPVFEFVGHPLLQAMWYLTAVTTVSSGLGYVINKDKHVKIQK